MLFLEYNNDYNIINIFTNNISFVEAFLINYTHHLDTLLLHKSSVEYKILDLIFKLMKLEIIIGRASGERLVTHKILC